MQKQTVGSNLIFVLALTALCATTGCRSMPGYSLLTWGQKPSTELMASAGPAVTYPTPPSVNSTPESIASVAGGTAIPDFEVDEGELTTQRFASSSEVPGYGEPVNNLAAARANGYAAPDADSSVSRVLPSADTAISATFGDRAITPKPNAAMGLVSESEMKGDSVTQPYEATTSADTGMNVASSGGHGFAPPNATTNQLPSVSGATTTGFMLPTDSPSFANLEPAASGVQVPANDQVSQSAQPDYSTASRPNDATISTSESVLPPAEVVKSQTSSGYSPGSTANALSYPTDGSTPTINGSYFR